MGRGRASLNSEGEASTLRSDNPQGVSNSANAILYGPTPGRGTGQLVPLVAELEELTGWERMVLEAIPAAQRSPGTIEVGPEELWRHLDDSDQINTADTFEFYREDATAVLQSLQEKELVQEYHASIAPAESEEEYLVDWRLTDSAHNLLEQ